MANEESGTSVDFEDMKKRGKAWGEIEEKFLIREVLQREDSLFGVIRGCGTKYVHRIRTDAWRQVADALKSYV